MTETVKLTFKQSASAPPRQIRLYSANTKEVMEDFLVERKNEVRINQEPGYYVLLMETLGYETQQVPLHLQDSELIIDLDEISGDVEATRLRQRQRSSTIARGFTIPSLISNALTHLIEDLKYPVIGFWGADEYRIMKTWEHFSSALVQGKFDRDGSLDLFGLVSGPFSSSKEFAFSQTDSEIRLETGKDLMRAIRRGRDKYNFSAATEGPLFVCQSPVDENELVALPFFTGRFSIKNSASGLKLTYIQVHRSEPDPFVPAMLAYLDQDVTDGADRFAAIAFQGYQDMPDGANMDEAAYYLLKDKFFDPFRAALGAYFLLRHGKFDLLRDWTRNLADYFPFMSDGLVIEGWRRLAIRGANSNPPWPLWRIKSPPKATPYNRHPNRRRPNDPIVDAALRFLEAHERGLPNFEYGYRKLRDGLSFCYDQLSMRTEEEVINYESEPRVQVLENSLLDELQRAILNKAETSRKVGSTAGLTTIRLL